jgi:hypothetical protein
MDEELWFEEEIVPAEAALQAAVEVAKELAPATWAELAAEKAAEVAGLGPLLTTVAGPLLDLPKARRAAAIEEYAREKLRGIIRAHRPGAVRLAPGTKGKGSDALPYARGDAYLVRLGVEFDLPDELKEAQYRYKKVYCRAFLETDDVACAPTVLEVYPDRLFEGGPKMVKLEFKPELTWKEVGGSLGSATTDVQVGAVAPATVGFLGDEQRAPYWEMTEKQQAILGRYHFWFVLDLPSGCDPAAVRLGLLGEGDLKFHIGPFPMGPRRRQREPEQWIGLGEIVRGQR